MENTYENFRNVLTANLCRILSADQLQDVLRAVDISLNDYEITRKQMELITAAGSPDVVKYYLASKAISNLSPWTLKQYWYKLTHFFDTVHKSYSEITSNDIRMYLYAFQAERHASDRYLENVRVTLNSFFSWLVDNDYIVKNPCTKVDHIRYEEKKREPLSALELEVFRWNTADIREKALIDFFFSTGCRVSECADVRLSDLNWLNRSVLIRHGKGGKSRTVYFNAESEVSLRAYLRTRTDDTDALFVSVRSPHQPLRSRALEMIIKKVAERTGIHVFPHRLRHTFATSGLRGGMSIEKLQSLLGHSSPQTTLIYAKLDQQDLQREHQRVYA